MPLKLSINICSSAIYLSHLSHNNIADFLGNVFMQEWMPVINKIDNILNIQMEKLLAQFFTMFDALWKDVG